MTDKDKHGFVVICALRYACGRQSYAPDIVQDYARRHFKDLSDKDLKTIDNDLRTTWEMGQRSGHSFFGDPRIDEPGWLRFWNDVEDELERRQGGARCKRN